MELITEKELGRLRTLTFNHNFSTPKYAGEIVVVRLEKMKFMLPIEEYEDLNNENWKPPEDLKCNIWMMDAVGEFIDLVQGSGNSALNGLVSISSDMDSYFPKAKIDLNAIQMSGTGMILVTLSTEKSSIYDTMKRLTINLDVVNPSKFRKRDNIDLYEKSKIESEKEEIWNVLSFSPTREMSVYDVNEDWNNIAVIMFFIYGDRWQVKPLSHMYFAQEISEKIKDSKNLCYALNSIILKNKEPPIGCKSIRSLLLGEKIEDSGDFYLNSENEGFKNLKDRMNELTGLEKSEVEALNGPMLLRNPSATTDYKYLIKRLNERKGFLKEFLEKNHDRITKGKVIIDQDGKVKYLTDDIINNTNSNSNNEITTNEYDTDEDENGWEIGRGEYTIESANQDVQILKQTVNEIQLQLVSIMDMFVSTTPPSFTIQGTANEITYKELIDEIQYLENTLALYKQDFISKKNKIPKTCFDNTGFYNENINNSELSINCKNNSLEVDDISLLQPFISNTGYSDFTEKIDKLRESVELFGQKSRKTVIENNNLNSDAREHAFRKVKSLECRCDKLNKEFNDFLFSISISSVPKHIHIN
ncbi:hypothetical protein FG386_001089 [Cryptosporidium ryanae]|uniref:uncharacterized protein n=1 Tax=Cryptosporidium ryanae TaxID=515981 RepID=UPI00351A3516|nr:hypothetical protein FG386_001089 [Cryptosporidium ryanae]